MGLHMFLVDGKVKAHDSRVLYNALTRRINNFQVPEGKIFTIYL